MCVCLYFHPRRRYMYSNLLTGTLPPSMGDLAKLNRLNLWNNALSGELPPSVSGKNESEGEAR